MKLIRWGLLLALTAALVTPMTSNASPVNGNGQDSPTAHQLRCNAEAKLENDLTATYGKVVASSLQTPEVHTHATSEEGTKGGVFLDPSGNLREYWFHAKMAVDHFVIGTCNDPDALRFRAHSWVTKCQIGFGPSGGGCVLQSHDSELNQGALQRKFCQPTETCPIDQPWGTNNFSETNNIHIYHLGILHYPSFAAGRSYRSGAGGWRVRFREIDHWTQQYQMCSRWFYPFAEFDGPHTASCSVNLQ